jgi:hypothetical protein
MDEIIVSHATTYTIHGSENTAAVLEQLRALRPERFPLVKEVYFSGIVWSQDIVHECDVAFQRYSSCPRWDWLAFYDMDDLGHGSNVHLGTVVNYAIKQNRSSSYLFSGARTESWTASMDQHVAEAISCVMNDVQDLDAIRIDSFCISNASMFQLSRNLVARKPMVGPSRLVLRDVYYSENYGQPYNGASEILATGLAGNSSLLELELFQTHVDDSRLSRLISALAGHPRLRQLNIGQSVLGTDSLDALRRLICTCQISGLRFAATIINSTPETNLKNLVEHIPPSLFLRSLEFSSNYVPSPDGEEDVRFVLENLSKWPNLVALNMESHSLESPESVLSAFSPLGSPSHLQRLYLDLNQPEDFASCSPCHPLVKFMFKFLTMYPRLGYLGCGPTQQLHRYIAYPPCIRHRMDMNRCGLDLLQGTSIPLSIWPLILARTKNDIFLQICVDYQASAIYHVLQSSTFQLYFDLHVQHHSRICGV